MIRVRQVKVKFGEENLLKKEVSHKLHINSSQILDLVIIRKSLDARRKDNIHYVYEVDVSVPSESKVLNKVHSKDIFLAPQEDYELPEKGNEKLSNRPIIVGSGPCGLFCAYMLAKEGYQPIVIERGDRVEKRVEEVTKFGTREY